MRVREILFRGKRKDNGRWVEGDLTHSVYKIGDTCVGTYGSEIGMHQVHSDTVGQFTGLTDKNGKRIFEGDVVICRQAINGNQIDELIEIGFVEMKHGSFGLHRKQGYYRPFKDWLEDYEYEVIGNIYDNPELLKGGANG